MHNERLYGARKWPPALSFRVGNLYGIVLHIDTYISENVSDPEIEFRKFWIQNLKMIAWKECSLIFFSVSDYFMYDIIRTENRCDWSLHSRDIDVQRVAKASL